MALAAAYTDCNDVLKLELSPSRSCSAFVLDETDDGDFAVGGG